MATLQSLQKAIENALPQPDTEVEAVNALNLDEEGALLMQSNPSAFIRSHGIDVSNNLRIVGELPDSPSDARARRGVIIIVVRTPDETIVIVVER
jgi:hypothetical protein